MAVTDPLTRILDEMGGVNPLPKVRPATEEVITPSGVVIRYEDKRHFYFINDVKVPSVSTILDVIDKSGPLKWWGMRIGVEGVLALVRAHGLNVTTATADEIVGVKEKGIKGLLTQHRLTVNHVSDKAAERGTTVHDALEEWAATGAMPSPAVYPEEQAGYVTGLAAFLKETVIEPEATEVIVGSVGCKFAGRYDLRCKIDGEPVLLDLKTSGKIYPEHFLQLEAYEGAGVECGYEPTMRRVVLRVGADGTWETKDSPASYADFLAVRACYAAVKDLETRVKEAA